MLNPFQKIKQLERKIEIYECEKVTILKYVKQLEKENEEQQSIIHAKNKQIKELKKVRDRLKRQVEDSQAEIESWQAYIVADSEKIRRNINEH
ncbi:hypothetical protein SAMN05421767_1589 [Granulicatella balaenopterae]|uniref:Uncharacterized protein n=2 Tax=Granulicatella balaenopterae TaxID=137733 RepID=A0A1H9PGR6_9LACT|nr:hypothetical protein SAMN05421767_1589 [Granulicatella balaenopterae]